MKFYVLTYAVKFSHVRFVFRRNKLFQRAAKIRKSLANLFPKKASQATKKYRMLFQKLADHNLFGFGKLRSYYFTQVSSGFQGLAGNAVLAPGKRLGVYGLSLQGK